MNIESDKSITKKVNKIIVIVSVIALILVFIFVAFIQNWGTGYVHGK